MKINNLLNKRPTLSFEIFPPKNHGDDLSSIFLTISQLAKLNPDFISVTYGAGGSTSKNTAKIASIIKNQYHIEAVAHLSCIDTSKEDLIDILNELKDNNIENILALRGDYPQDYDQRDLQGDFKYASDLNEFISEQFPDQFCLSGACYPETHFEAESFEQDLQNLKKKVDAGAKYLVTQLFFDNQYYYRLIKRARQIGINVPIIAGIMPATSSKQLKRLAKISDCSIPYSLASMMERFLDDPEACKEVGLHYATYQIIDLMSQGVDGIHIYTMNKPEIAEEILKRTKAIRREYFKD